VRLSFIPGDLYLSEDGNVFTVTFRGEAVLQTKSKKAALSRYNSLRSQLESLYPLQDITPEEKEERWRIERSDSLVGHNSVRPPRRKVNPSRTFG
jgi:hypothetical protein